MKGITTVLRQPVDTPQGRAVALALMVEDDLAGIRRCSVRFEALAEHAAGLTEGTHMPVGSVEYVRAAMEIAGIREPASLSYPSVLEDLLRREVLPRRAGSILGEWFVKPRETKRFTGFVFHTMADPDTLDPNDREQYAAFMALDADTLVWAAEPVVWLSEVRYYVLRGQIVGHGRYDQDGRDDAPLPDLAVVQLALGRLVAELGPDLTCAIDMGVLAGGETALVEVNDAWAIGLYGDALRPGIYFDFLATRWRQLVEGRSS